VSAEIDGPVTSLSPSRLMSGFYLNELLLKLTERCDPHPEIFFSYAWCVQALCDGEIEEPTLRRFEKRLLNDLGYGLELAKTGDGVPVERDGYYRFALQSGPQPAWPRRPARFTVNPWPTCRRELRRRPLAPRCQARVAGGHRFLSRRPLLEIA